MTKEAGDIVVTPVPPEMVDIVWPRVKDYIEAAAKTSRGKCTIDDIKDGIDGGVYLLWAIVLDDEIVAALTSRIIQYPRCKGMVLDWIGGKRMREWIERANAVMVDHAKRNGCSHLEGYGRPAWIRWNRKHGWKEDYTAFTLEV